MEATFWRRLDLLLAHRLPLIDALTLLQRESRDPKERQRVGEIIERLRAGEPFSKAAASGLQLGILAAGEASGDLPGAIHRIAERVEGQGRLRAQLLSAILYPAFILVLALLLCVLLTSVVLPRFQTLFLSLGVGGELPPLTAGLIAFSKWAQHWGLFTSMVLGVLIFFLYTRYRGVALSAWLCSWPLLGSIWSMGHRQQLYGALGLLLQSGIPLDSALQTASLAVANTPLSEKAITASRRVREGDRLSVALRALSVGEESELQVVALSESTGALGETLLHLSGLLEEQLKVRLKAAMTMLEPVLILFMAGLVGLMVVALFLPLGPLVSRLSQGS